jgi:hypothetical protein
MDQNFRVVRVEPNRDELIAMAGKFQVARAAYDTAVSLWPNVLIELRQGARVGEFEDAVISKTFGDVPDDFRFVT